MIMKNDVKKKPKIPVKVYFTPKEHDEYLKAKPENTTLNRYITDCLYLFHHPIRTPEGIRVDEEFARIMDKLTELEKTRKDAVDDENNIVEAARNKFKSEYESLVPRIVAILKYSPIALSELEIAASVHENAEIVFYTISYMKALPKIPFENEFFVLIQDKKRNWKIEKA